jgi:hypothetical protein
MPLTYRDLPVAAGRRTALAAVVCVLLAVTAAAGCGRRGGDDQPVTGGNSGLGAGPTSSLSPAPPPPPPTFPSTSREYGEAVVGAWTGGDQGRLGELTTPEVNDQLLQIPGPPSPDWTYLGCDTGHYCSFSNGDGDLLILLIPAASVGQANATAQVSYNATSYPDDDLDYVREFVGAWQNDNLTRMQKLALPEAIEVFQQVGSGEVFGYGRVGGGAGLSIVLVSGVGFEVEVHVRTMFLGHPHAIALAFREV